MEKPKLESKTYKRVVPLKGNLLQKLRSEFKKELSKNDNEPNENGANETTNNNTNSEKDPAVKSPLKELDKKIIIQKVECVKIEMITTSPEGPMRRLSDLFTPVPHTELFPALKAVDAEAADKNDEIPSEVDENLLSAQAVSSSVANPVDAKHNSITLLSTRMPGNCYNQKVPLKMVRTLKPPKPKPNLRFRHHRVETFKTLESETTPPTSEVEVEILIPDIQMMDETLSEIQPVVQEKVIKATQDPVAQQPTETPAAQLLVQEKVDGETVLNVDASMNENSQDLGLEPDLAGFPTEDENFDEGLMKWFKILKMDPVDLQTVEVQLFDPKLEIIDAKHEVFPENSFPDKQGNESHEKVEPTPSVKPSAMPRINKKKPRTPPVKRATKVLKKKSDRNESSSDSNAAVGSSAISLNAQPPKNEIVIETPVEDMDLIESKAQVESVSPVKNTDSPSIRPVQEEKPNAQDSEVVLPTAAKEKIGSHVPKNLKQSMKTVKSKEVSEPEWMNDLLGVLGASRIKEIDKMLKVIPNLVTGNAIETENVELKLIIRHLMRKFKVTSIMDTLEEESTNHERDTSSDEDYDDFPGSFDDDSHGPDTFFNESVDDSFDNSVFEDEDPFNSFFHKDLPGTSQAAPSTHNDDVKPIGDFAEDSVTRPMNFEASFNDQQTSFIPFDESETKTESNDESSLAQTIFTITEIEEEPVKLQTRRGEKRTSSLPAQPKTLKKLKSCKVDEPKANPPKPSFPRQEIKLMIQEEAKSIKTEVENVKELSTGNLASESRRKSLHNSSHDSFSDSGKDMENVPSNLLKETKQTPRSEKPAKQFNNDRKSLRNSTCDSTEDTNEVKPSSLENHETQSSSRSQNLQKLLSDSKTRRDTLRSSSRDSSADSANDGKLNDRNKKTRVPKDGDKRKNSFLNSCEPVKRLSRSGSTINDDSIKLATSVASETNAAAKDVQIEKPLAVASRKSSKGRSKAMKEEIMSESDSGPTKHLLRSQRIQPTDESVNDLSMQNVMSSDDSENLLSKLKRSRISRCDKGHKNDAKKKANGRLSKISKRRTTRKIVDSSSESDKASDADTETSRNLELKSRLTPLDFNSKRKSSVFIRNDYIKPKDEKRKVDAGMSQVLQKLSDVITATKKSDPTYTESPGFKKRERLRTSAFKGNHEEDTCNHSEPETRPSVSRGSSIDSAVNQTNLESLSEKSQPTPPKKRGRKIHIEIDKSAKREFTQEPLEPAKEKLVPYDQISEAIISGNSPRIQGRIKREAAKEKAEKLKMLKEKLKELEFFHCGSCNCDVTKHLWIDHFMKHGGIAWIEGFDAPIDIGDWSEALRRSIRNFKIYNVDVMKCPHCQAEKRSALSHLSHLITCAESEEVIEQRKLTCKLCNEKYFPFNATVHKNKCSGYQKLQEHQESEVESEEEKPAEADEECLNLSGRTKRNAVKRAEKKFKQVLKSLERPSDHLDVVSGQLRCHICGSTNFETQDEALNHIQTEHVTGGDFEGGSDSDEGLLVEEESSDETEGSSGVESSEMSSEEEILVENEDSFVSSSKKAKQSACEPQEVKNARALISEYVETFRDKDVAAKIFQWTKQFADDNWKTEVFPQILPKINSTLIEEPKALLPTLQFKLKSIKFGVKQAGDYVSTYENGFRKSWQQLDIGENYSNNDSSTIYCGGSVASLDWAPVSSGQPNFLAVACNSKVEGMRINLTESVKSCVQVYEFLHLKNKSFEGFQNKSKLSYVIVIDDGPVWSIKFHPCESTAQKRIGLLAVTTSNQKILIYSMPYLSSDKPNVLALQPNLICKLQQDEVLFNDEFLLQALKVGWYHKSGHDSILAAGFVNGLVGVWNISNHVLNDSKSNVIYPLHVIHAHFEPVTALDFKTAEGEEFHLLTASGDRKFKVYTFDEIGYQEIASHYSTSRLLCSEWWMNWPGFLYGIDDCFTHAQLMYRQPLEFGIRNSNLMTISSPTTDLSINHWMNFAMFVTDSGDVIGCRPKQMLIHSPKDRWGYFRFNMFSYTDFDRIVINDVEEIGIVFGDFKCDLRQPKKFRLAPTERINELQINQVCFNRNEESCRFYALGYETGFVRIRYLKNSK